MRFSDRIEDYGLCLQMCGETLDWDLYVTESHRLMRFRQKNEHNDIELDKDIDFFMTYGFL